MFPCHEDNGCASHCRKLSSAIGAFQNGRGREVASFLLVVELTSEREVVLYARPRDEHRGVPHDAQQSEGRLQPRRGDVAGGAQDHGQEDQHADEGDGNEEPYEVTEEGEVEADFVSKVLLDLLHGTWFVTSG